MVYCTCPTPSCLHLEVGKKVLYIRDSAGCKGQWAVPGQDRVVSCHALALPAHFHELVGTLTMQLRAESDKIEPVLDCASVLQELFVFPGHTVNTFTVWKEVLQQCTPYLRQEENPAALGLNYESSQWSSIQTRYD